MATLAKTWQHDVNNLLDGGGTNQPNQYAELFLALHTIMKAAGYTVAASSDGVTADATDRVSEVADIVVSSSGNRTWVIYDMPANGHAYSSPAPQLMIEVYETNTTSPDTLRISGAGQGYDLGGSYSPSSPPSTFGATQSAFNFSTYDIIPWANTSVVAYWSAIYTDEGDVFFFVKGTVSNNFSSMFCIRQDTAARTGGRGSNLCAFFATAASNHTTPITPPFGAFNVFQGFNEDGSVAETSAGTSPGEPADAWGSTNGLDSDGEMLDWPVFLCGNTASHNRWLGLWTDIRKVSNDIPFGAVQDGDTDLMRYLHVGNGLLIPWPAAGLPVE